MTKSRKRITALRTILIVLTLAVLFVVVDIILSQKALMVTEYTVSNSKIESPIRIVQLTDLHNASFGKNNSRLVAKVRAQSPDLILITGDLINNKTGADTKVAENLIHELNQIAPVYVSYGNQEEKSDKYLYFASIYESAGAIVLENEWQDIEIHGQPLRIGGVYGYCLPDTYAQDRDKQEDSAFLKEFQQSDRYKILMCHMPLSWVNGKAMYDWDVDLVFTGHFHGGQIRIPFVGGLWAPDMGWFPGEVAGMYVSEEEKWPEVFESLKNHAKNQTENSYYTDDRSYYETTVILSRGLGNTEWVPRFNNIPEIVVTDLIPQ